MRNYNVKTAEDRNISMKNYTHKQRNETNNKKF